jgi:hypothetical protein
MIKPSSIDSSFETGSAYLPFLLGECSRETPCSIVSLSNSGILLDDLEG